jgi:hypothetical protein
VSWLLGLFAAIGSAVPGRLILPLMALAAVAMIALALVWPQGSGRRSPPPFGHARPAAARTR